jgi:4-amino-4-deoxy-L-arabinose transferase-like glycosyltransferase
VISLPPKSRVAAVAIAILIVIALARITGTYAAIGQTYDEAAHIATGMEWLDQGTFLYEPKHPPLPRVTIALGPYLDGQRAFGLTDFWEEGNRILHSGPSYRRTLTLARLGVLPFFVLAALAAGAWGRRLAGPAGAVGAVLLFTTLPLALAHSGVATTDMGITAMLPLTMLLFVRWLERRDAGRSLLLGAGIGLSLLAKMSAVLMLPVSFVAVLAIRWLVMRKTAATARPAATSTGRRIWLRHAGCVALAAFVVTWAGYRFSLGSLVDPRNRPYEGLDMAVGTTGRLHDVAYRVIEAPVIPAYEFLLGMRQLLEHNGRGHKSFLMDEVRDDGWWYFFPAALLVKTPLPFLVLVVAGSATILMARPRRWEALAPLAVAAAILLSVIPSRINIGLRHILPIYPLLSAVAGAGAVALWQRTRQAAPARLAAAGLIGWQIVGTAPVHPDYLTYFNALAGSRPDRVLIFSDLDWGQDLTTRLLDTLRARGVDSVTLAVGNNIPTPYLRQMGFPPIRRLRPFEYSPGYVAVDLYGLRLGDNTDNSVPSDAFAWAERYQPVAMIGRTIRLYHFPELPPVPLYTRLAPAPTEAR